MDGKTKVSVRLHRTTIAYVYALADTQGTDFTRTIEALIQIGLENRKDVERVLERQREIALEAMKFEEADAQLHIELKKAYLVENFRKLAHKIIHAGDMSERRRRAVVESMFARVEKVLGKSSDEYKECERIFRVREERRRQDDTSS